MTLKINNKNIIQINVNMKAKKLLNLVDPMWYKKRYLRLRRTKMNDWDYIHLYHRFVVGGSKFDVNNPQTFNEKLNWLKLNYHKPEFTQMVDKYEVKKIVADKIGSVYVVKSYGVWNHFDDIDFNTLPNQFVLKCTHDSGSVVVVKDKEKMNIPAIRKKLEKALRLNYYYVCREWPYYNVQPRIIAEEYIPSLGQRASTEYKISCFDGKVKFITVCGGIAHSDVKLRTNDHFTPEWEQLHWMVVYRSSGQKIKKPGCAEKLVELSNKLADGIPYVRVDWYVTDDKIYFGELTFYTWGGFCKFEPEEWNATLGSWITLPKPCK